MSYKNSNPTFKEMAFCFFLASLMFICLYWSDEKKAKTLSDKNKLKWTYGRITYKPTSRNGRASSYDYIFHLNGEEYDGSSYPEEYLYEIGDSCYVYYNIVDPDYSRLLAYSEIKELNLWAPWHIEENTDSEEFPKPAPLNSEFSESAKDTPNVIPTLLKPVYRKY